MIRYITEKKPVVRVCVEMRGDVQEYALNFLKIFNNVRDNPELLMCYNDHYSHVYVICEPSAEDATVDFLGWFGTVTDTEELTGLLPVLDESRLTPGEWDELENYKALPVDTAGFYI